MVAFSVGSVDSVANLGWRGRARAIRRIVAPQFPEEPKKTARLRRGPGGLRSSSS